MKALKKEQNLTRIQLVRMYQLKDPEPRTANRVKFDDRIQTVCDSTTGDVVEILKKVANVCLWIIFDNTVFLIIIVFLINIAWDMILNVFLLHYDYLSNILIVIC